MSSTGSTGSDSGKRGRNTPPPTGKTCSSGSSAAQVSALRDAMSEMAPEEKISLLKKAVVNVTKSKNELEIRVGGLMEELEAAEKCNGLLSKTNSTLTMENEDLKAKVAELQQQQQQSTASSHQFTAGASAALKGITTFIPGLGGKKGAGGSSAEGGHHVDSAMDGSLSKEDAIQIIQENEKLHIQLFELKGTLEQRIQSLSQLNDSLTKGDKHHDELLLSLRADKDVLEAQLAKTKKENEHLVLGLQTAAKAMRESQQRLLVEDQTVREMDIQCFGTAATLVKEAQLSRHNSSSVAVFEGETGNLLNEAAETLQRDASIFHPAELLGEVHAPLESIVFAVHALIPACIEAIQTLFRNHREALEWKRQLRVCGYSLKTASTPMMEMIAKLKAAVPDRRESGESSTAAPEQVELPHVGKDDWGLLIRWLVAVADHAFFLVLSVFLSAAIPKEEAQREAEAVHPQIQIAISEFLLWIRRQQLLSTNISTEKESICDYPPHGLLADNHYLSLTIIPALEKALKHVAGQVSNEKVRMALQHIYTKLSTIGDVLKNCEQPSRQKEGLGDETHSPASTASSPSGSPKHNRGREIAAPGQTFSAVGIPSSMSANEVDKLRKEIDQLRGEKETLKRGVKLADRRVYRIQQQFQEALAELDFRSNLSERTEEQVAALKRQVQAAEDEKRATVESFEGQIQILSNRLVELSPADETA